jgi:hypothetical protein
VTDFFDKAPDPLEALLAPPVAPGGDAGLREAVFRRTAEVLRRRRRLRALARGGALAACYLAGLLATHGLEHRPPAAPTESLTRPPQAGAPVVPPAAVSALAAEWQAFDSPDRGAELYRRAGDRYLTEEADPLAAVRCYGNALNSGTAQDLAFDANDSWLLMAIKDARQKEKRDANATN